MTPGTGKVYEATVSYLYQVKLGDGERTTIATTLATSYQYTIPYGTGTYGSGNQNSLAFEFEPKLVIIQGTSGRMAVMIKPSGIGVSIGADSSTTLTVAWSDSGMSWYSGLSADAQMNTAGETYSYTAFG